MNINFRKKLVWTGLFVTGLAVLVLVYELISTIGRTQIQVNIHQNKKLIYLSTFAEPPQFAVWLEDPVTHHCVTVFVTHRVGIGDWEGKANVPVALPHWYQLFKLQGKKDNQDQKNTGKNFADAVTGATPKGDFFSVREEVKSGSHWICWVEMNLAGDYNDSYLQQNLESKEEDEFSNGQPALLYRSDIIANEGEKFEFVLFGESIWKDGETSVESVSKGVTTAKEVFDKMEVEIIRPKPKLINWQKKR